MSQQNYLCIRGYMKSGTNWICRILNQHPDVNCAGEFHWHTFFDALKQNVQRIAPQRRQWLNDTVRPELQSMVSRSLTQLIGKDSLWIGDRTPTTIEPIVIPNARHMVAVRDFRDVIVSRMFHLYNNPGATGIFDRSPELKLRLDKFRSDSWYFRDHPEQLLDNEEVVRDSARDWRSFLESDRQTISGNPDLSVLVIQYETLHSNFENEVDRIFQFLGLSPPNLNADVLPGHETENPSALNRKGQVGDWQNYFSDDVKRWVNEEVLDELLRLNYVDSSDW